MRAHRLIAAAALAAVIACSKGPSGEQAPPPVQAPPSAIDGPTRGAPAAPTQETPVGDSTLKLHIPDGVTPALYQRVRDDATLGPALDRQMVPALERAGAAAERVAAFTAARDAALRAWTPAPTAAEAASPATGPMEHPARTAFDAVSTDVLRAFFGQHAEAIGKGQPRADAIAALSALEALARASFGWDASAAQTVATQVMLVRAGLEQQRP